MTRYSRGSERFTGRSLCGLDEEIRKKNIKQISLHAKLFIVDLGDLAQQQPSTPFRRTWREMLPHARTIRDAAKKGDCDRTAESFKDYAGHLGR